MNLELIKDKKVWQKFIKENKANLLESWQWKKFQDSLKNQVEPIALKGKKEILLAGLVIKKNLVFNKSYLYIPKGPIFKKGLDKDKKNEIFSEFVEKIKKRFQDDNPIFLKIEPENNKLNSDKYKILKTKPRQPEKTAILDLSPSKEDILKNMHSKTRYNIRLAKRKGVTTKKSQNFKDIEKFLDLLHITTSREGFQAHPDDYYKKLLKLDNIDLYLAFFENTPIAAHIVGFFRDFGYYLHGASSREHRKVMGPHRLHWKIIKDLKQKGLKYYDFWGIDKEKWPGLTRFKTSFGSSKTTYPGTFDLVFKPIWYSLYLLGKKIKS